MNKKIIAILLRRSLIGARHDIKKTVNLLGLKYINNLVCREFSQELKGMLQKAKDFILHGVTEKRDFTLGETYKMHPPIGGFGRKKIYGKMENIDLLINKMIQGKTKNEREKK